MMIPWNAVLTWTLLPLMCYSFPYNQRKTCNLKPTSFSTESTSTFAEGDTVVLEATTTATTSNLSLQETLQTTTAGELFGTHSLRSLQAATKAPAATVAATAVSTKDDSVMLSIQQNRNEQTVTKQQRQQTVMDEKKSKMVLADLLVMFAGIANIVCFQKFGFYSSMMTGNTIRFCTALAEMRLKDAEFAFVTILSYTLGAALFRCITLQHEQALEQHQRLPVHMKLLHRQSDIVYARLSLTAFFVFAASDVIFRFFPSMPRKYMGCVLALGFGFVNAVSVKETNVITWAATGYVNKLGMGLVDALVLGTKNVKPAVASSNEMNLRLFGIFLGSVFGTAALAHRSGTFLAPILGYLPPAGTSFGLFYGGVFAWYGWQVSQQISQQVILMLQPVMEADDFLVRSSPTLQASTTTSSGSSLWGWFPFFNNNRNGYQGGVALYRNDTASVGAWL